MILSATFCKTRYFQKFTVIRILMQDDSEFFMGLL